MDSLRTTEDQAKPGKPSRVLTTGLPHYSCGVSGSPCGPHLSPTTPRPHTHHCPPSRSHPRHRQHYFLPFNQHPGGLMSLLVENITTERLVEEPCTEWDFDNTTFISTVTSEFQLVCDKQYLRATYHGMYMFGTLAGSCFNGYLADK
ncbi:hypothetical protein Pmani_033645 [Petrolisthes manimaculis]|uniref:Uncharacterized protein n=1 Tax=Petrolisthes manimaculis TaxID=1843537 RepID=A0AAE1TSF1_9EUCA|nr:hypothetical protein Pmani_033645 [Petrolisthes manimaculis]